MSIEFKRQTERDGIGLFLNSLAHWWGETRRNARIRREYRELMNADDRILKDVGLTRMQVEFERRRSKRWRA